MRSATDLQDLAKTHERRLAELKDGLRLPQQGKAAGRDRGAAELARLLDGPGEGPGEGATRQSLMVHDCGEGAEIYWDLWPDPAADPELR